MRAAQDAAVEFLGRPKDMTFRDFLDTALHFLFKEHGITLAGYTISDEARKALEEDKAQEARSHSTIILSYSSFFCSSSCRATLRSEVQSQQLGEKSYYCL